MGSVEGVGSCGNVWDSVSLVGICGILWEVWEVWWTEGVGFGISSIASSSLGDRKKGYPKRQALWELTLALGRFPFVFEFFWIFLCFSSISIDFGGFLMILGSDCDILEFLRIW